MTALALRGAQDIHFLSNIDLTVFRILYRRHTNFQIGELVMPFQSNATFGRNRITGQLQRSGDLLAAVYLYVLLDQITYTVPGNYDPTVPNAAWYVDAIGHAMLLDQDITIGHTEFDDQNGEYLELHDCLMAPPEKLLHEMSGHAETDGQLMSNSLNQQHLYIPFRFWFSKWIEQALPMVALYWHDVNVNLSTRPIAQLVKYAGAITSADVTVPADPLDMHMLCNYVYLDRAERAAFANGKHEYLFEQMQFLGEVAHPSTEATNNINIRFNHPVNELIWVCQQDAKIASLDWFDFSGKSTSSLHPVVTTFDVPQDPFLTGQIELNNHDRTIEHPAQYYRTVQPYQAHSRFPHRWVYCYSFSTHPEGLLDSGSVNFSRMDSAFLRLTFPTDAVLGWTGQVRVYARSKQVAKVNAGMMGVKYGG